MAILAIFTGNGMTKQMYESLREEIDWIHNHPLWAILHATGFDNSGNKIQVADIWESEEDLNRFIKEKLTPAVQKLNLPVAQREVFQVHSVDAFSAIDRYIIK